MTKLADILDGLDLGISKTVELCNFLTIWNKVIDERVGQHTEAVKISHQTLYVKTSSAAWANELTFFKPEFIEKFNQLAGKIAITDIRFKTGG